VIFLDFVHYLSDPHKTFHRPVFTKTAKFFRPWRKKTFQMRRTLLTL